METSTKNKQSIDVMKAMVAKAFGQVDILDLEELKEGCFNVAYLLTLSEIGEVILKIAPPKASVIMSFEKKMMFSEVDSMNRVLENSDVPIAQILYYDNSHLLCDSDYFFMSKLSGQSLYTLKEDLTDKVKDKIYYLLGQYNYKINQMTNQKFGYYGLTDTQGDSWYQVFKNMVCMLIEDSKLFHIDFKVNTDQLLTLLERDKEVFEEVDTPRLIHWDLWAGNIFVQDDTISGLIDFERCLWGDILMENGFRTHELNKSFLEGYGITCFTKNQETRILWYDIYLFLIMSQECDYRNYETRDLYHWATAMLKQRLEEVAKG